MELNLWEWRYFYFSIPFDGDMISLRHGCRKLMDIPGRPKAEDSVGNNRLYINHTCWQLVYVSIYATANLNQFTLANGFQHLVVSCSSLYFDVCWWYEWILCFHNCSPHFGTKVPQIFLIVVLLYGKLLKSALF